MYLDHAALMQQHGFAATYFSMRHSKNLPCVDEDYFCEKVDPAAALSLMERAQAAARLIYNQNARACLSNLLAVKPVQLAHIHSVYHHLSPSILDELRSRSIPTVMTVHDLKLLCPAYTMFREGHVCEACKPKKTWNVMRNKCIKDSALGSAVVLLEAAVHQLRNTYGGSLAKIIVPSKFYLNKFVEWGWPAQQLIYIPNFVQPQNNVSMDTRPDGNRTSVLFAGRLSAEKGVDTLIRASALSNVAVVIAGDGPMAEPWRALAQSLGAPVRFLGWLGEGQLRAQMMQCTAVAVPSIWYENAPLSVLESLSLGAPVIGADIGGIPELVTEDVGWLFSPRNVEALAGCLSHVASLSTGQLAQIGQRAKLWAGNAFSPNSYALRMAALYDQIS